MPIPDAPGLPSGYFLGGCDPTAPLTALTFPDVPIGQTATYVVTLTVGFRDQPSVSLTGSPAFGAVLSLGVGQATVEVTFRPSTLGPQHAVLHGNGAEVTIDGNGIAALPDGPLWIERYFDNRMGQVRIENRSASTPIDLYSLTRTPEGSVGDSSLCPTTLQPGDGCYLNLEIPATDLGCQRSTVTLHSSANPVQITFETFTRTNTQIHPASFLPDPAGACDGMYCTASPVVLTALAPAGQRFVGWSIGMGCDQGPMCTFRPDTGVLLEDHVMRFAATAAPRIDLTLAGAAAGKILMYEDDGAAVACDTGTCSFGQSVGGNVRLIATTPSTFVGWTGACAGTNPQCNLGAPTADVTVGAMFAKDPYEIATIVPPQHQDEVSLARQQAGFLPGGDVVIAAASMVSRMTLAGTVVWSRAADAYDLVTTPGGDIYYLGLSGTTPVVTRLDAAGNTVWSRALIRARDASGCNSAARALALTAGGNLAVVAYNMLRVVSVSDGSDVWTQPVTGCRTLAATATTVALAVDGPSGSVAITRYDTTGARVLPDWTLPDGELDMAYDPQGHLAVSILHANQTSTLTRLDPTGAADFSITRAVGGRPEVLAVAANGDLVTADPSTDSFAGLALRRYSPAGALVWSADKPAFTSAAAPSIGVVPLGLAPDPAGNVLVLGGHRLGVTYSQIPIARPFATLVAAP